MKLIRRNRPTPAPQPQPAARAYAPIARMRFPLSPDDARICARLDQYDDYRAALDRALATPAD